MIKIKSQIDKDGYQYFTGACEEYKIDDNGLQDGMAWEIEIFHAQGLSRVRTFKWERGVPVDFKTIKIFKEILTEQELESALRKCKVEYI